MKTVKKILLIICVLVIAVGMFLLGKNGLNYIDGYTKNILIDNAKQYANYIGIATIIVLLYYSIRYYKTGVLKILGTSILGIMGSIVFVLALMAIIRMPINRLFFPIMLATYVASIIALSANFEEKN